MFFFCHFQFGNTALLLAAANENVKVLNVLLERGANADVVNKVDMSLFHSHAYFVWLLDVVTKFITSNKTCFSILFLCCLGWEHGIVTCSCERIC